MTVPAMPRHLFNPTSLDPLPGESHRPPLRLLERRARVALPAARQHGPALSWDKVLGAVRRAWGG
jgi:hypothetical protein